MDPIIAMALQLIQQQNAQLMTQQNEQLQAMHRQQQEFNQHAIHSFTTAVTAIQDNQNRHSEQLLAAMTGLHLRQSAPPDAAKTDSPFNRNNDQTE